MEKAQKARKIIRKIVVQGNYYEIQNLFNELWKAHEDEFREDTYPSLIDFIFEQMIIVMKKNCACNKKTFKGILKNIIDREYGESDYELGQTLASLEFKYGSSEHGLSRYDIAKEGVKCSLNRDN